MQRTQPLPAAEPAPSALDMDLDISEAMPLDGKKENSLEFELSDLAELGGGTVIRRSMNRRGEMYHKGLDAGKTPMLDIGKNKFGFFGPFAMPFG